MHCDYHYSNPHNSSFFKWKHSWRGMVGNEQKAVFMYVRNRRKILSHTLNLPPEWHCRLILPMHPYSLPEWDCWDPAAPGFSGSLMWRQSLLNYPTFLSENKGRTIKKSTQCGSLASTWMYVAIHHTQTCMYMCACTHTHTKSFQDLFFNGYCYFFLSSRANEKFIIDRLSPKKSCYIQF